MSSNIRNDGSPTPTSLPAQPGEPSGIDGLSNDLVDELAERRFDEIEMMGEEQAAELAPPTTSVTIGMRYLHSSRTIQQLINDRNRAVGLYLGVASLLWTGSAALLNARPAGELLVPIEMLQRWCMPATFLILAILALFVALLLVRARTGLIYEVAKMNVLLGRPALGRVQRVNPLSIFFLMHLTICLSGGLAGALFTHQLLYSIVGPVPALGYAALVGVLLTVFLIVLYVVMVVVTTAEQKLHDATSSDKNRG